MAEDERPLISVVTPTWQRHKQVLQCIRSVVEQDYPRVQHVVVSDGPDDELEKMLRPMCRKYGTEYELIFEALPEHTGQYRWGHLARLRAIEISDGDIISYLDDDNRYRPEHLSNLQQILASTLDAQFAYSAVLFHDANHKPTTVIGNAPPRYCGIDTSAIMHYRHILDIAAWRDDGRQITVDWDLVRRWLKAGIAWGYDERISVDYFKSPPA